MSRQLRLDFAQPGGHLFTSSDLKYFARLYTWIHNWLADRGYDTAHDVQLTAQFDFCRTLHTRDEKLSGHGIVNPSCFRQNYLRSGNKMVCLTSFYMWKKEHKI